MLSSGWKPIPRCALAALLATPLSCAWSQVLYDAALATLPAAQGWTYAALPGLAQQTHTGTAVRLDTSALVAEQAGFARQAPVPLEATHGFALLFSVQLHAEQHASADRAGFSVILLGDDHRGLELGFWTDRVFAQSDSPLFTHAEEGLVDLTSGWVDCALMVQGTRYTFRAGVEAVLTGPVPDYTAFSGFIDPYETPNFIFLGDDTSSASAAFSVRWVALVTPPRLELQPDGAFGWTGLRDVPYTVESSADLVSWSTVTVLASSTGHFRVDPPALGRHGFFRAAFR